MSSEQNLVKDALTDPLLKAKSSATEPFEGMERAPRSGDDIISPLLAPSEVVDDELTPYDIGFVSPDELAIEMTELNPKAKQLPHDKTTKQKKSKNPKYTVKLVNNYDKPVDDQNPWYFRFLHGAKAGSLIGASAGALFSPAAPVVSTAVGTIFGAIAGGTFTAFIGPIIGGIAKQYFPKVYKYFYPPYVKVELALSELEYNYIVNSPIAYHKNEFNLEAQLKQAVQKEKIAEKAAKKATPAKQAAALAKHREATEQRIQLAQALLAEENNRKRQFNEAKQGLQKLGQDGLKLRYLYPQKSTQFSRPSIFLKWDMNTMMGALAGVTIGAAIGTLLGGPIGAAIGGVVGGAVGVAVAIAVPHIAQRTQNAEIIVTPVSKQNKAKESEEIKNLLELDKTLTNPANKANIPTSPKPKLGSWYEESPNDVPFFIRLAVGAAGGAAAGAALGSVVPVIGTAIGTAAGALIGAGGAYFSPTIFRLARAGIISVKNIFVKPDDKPKEPENDERDDQNWPESLKEDQHNLNWYVRLMPGIVAGAAVGAAIGTIFPGVGTVIGGAVGAAIGAGLAVASPMIFAAARKAVAGIKFGYSFLKKRIYGEQESTDTNNLLAAENSSEQSQKKNVTQNESDEFDVPWYIRALAGATTGAAVGGTIGLIAGTVFPGIGNLVGVTVGTAIGTIAGTAVVVVWPPLRDGVVNLFTSVKEKLFPKTKAVEEPDYFVIDQKTKACKQVSKDDYLIASAENPKDKSIPWFVKSMAGSMAGSIIGGAIGAVVGSIFPGIGTVLGGLAGAAIGGAAATAIYYVGSLIVEKIEARKQAAEEKAIVSDYRTSVSSKNAVVSRPAAELQQNSPVAFNAVSTENRDKKAVVALIQSRKRQSAVTAQLIGVSAAATHTNVATEQFTNSNPFSGMGLSS